MKCRHEKDFKCQMQVTVMKGNWDELDVEFASNCEVCQTRAISYRDEKAQRVAIFIKDGQILGKEITKL